MWFFNLTKKIVLKFFSRKEKISELKENINDEIENLSQNYSKSVQEDLPFINNKNNKNISKTKFKLPSIDFLKSPTKMERKTILMRIILIKTFWKKFF